MRGSRYLPAGDRPGRQAWLGPASVILGLVSWPIPAAGPFIAAVAIALGILSMTIRTEYRIDWTAVAGVVVGTGQLGLSMLLSLV